ncbi:MAG: hypothetical protein K9M57_04655, partial [Phycisphaerae bacterium]|nr:hypothetical protein [Phycisphaerae bacterium]
MHRFSVLICSLFLVSAISFPADAADSSDRRSLDLIGPSQRGKIIHASQPAKKRIPIRSRYRMYSDSDQVHIAAGDLTRTIRIRGGDVYTTNLAVAG